MTTPESSSSRIISDIRKYYAEKNVAWWNNLLTPQGLASSLSQAESLQPAIRKVPSSAPATASEPRRRKPSIQALTKPQAPNHITALKLRPLANRKTPVDATITNTPTEEILTLFDRLIATPADDEQALILMRQIVQNYLFKQAVREFASDDESTSPSPASTSKEAHLEWMTHLRTEGRLPKQYAETPEVPASRRVLIITSEAYVAQMYAELLSSDQQAVWSNNIEYVLAQLQQQPVGKIVIYTDRTPEEWTEFVKLAAKAGVSPFSIIIVSSRVSENVQLNKDELAGVTVCNSVYNYVSRGGQPIANIGMWLRGEIRFPTKPPAKEEPLPESDQSQSESPPEHQPPPSPPASAQPPQTAEFELQRESFDGIPRLPDELTLDYLARVEKQRKEGITK